MKINISKVRVTPKNIPKHCAVYAVTPEIMEWIEANNLSYTKHEKGYLNISIEGDVMDFFSVDKSWEYFDGFSPNLNKSLHLGHLSNLIYASAISNLCPCMKPVSILNDTDNHPDENKFFDEYREMCLLFNYNRFKDFFSSQSVFTSPDIKSVSEGQFEGCMSISTNLGERILIKSDGTTTYLYQDLGFAQKLGAPILYLTGAEQVSHFDTVMEFFPDNKHLPIGLLTTDFEKMSSRKGNVVYLKDVLKQYSVNTLKDTFLNYSYKTFKNNLKIETGLSKHFTGAAEKFENKKLYLIYLAAQNNYNPSLLYNSLKNESVNDIDYGLKLLGYTPE